MMIDYRPPAEKVDENRVRRRAARLGCRLERSRARRLHISNEGLYQLIFTTSRTLLSRTRTTRRTSTRSITTWGATPRPAA